MHVPGCLPPSVRSDIFANAIFRSIVLSLLATYGLWLYASIIFFVSTLIALPFPGSPALALKGLR